MTTRVAVLATVLAAIALAAGCTSSNDSAKPARANMTRACFQYAQTILSTDPTSGIPQMTLQQGVAEITAAATTAQTAARLDKRWADGPGALTTLADAMRRTDSTAMQRAIPNVRAICDPLIASVQTTTPSSEPA